MMTTLTWTNPTANTDGGAYDAATQNGGYELAFDVQEPSVSLPFAFGTSFDFGSTQAYQDLKSGAHVVRLRVVSKTGAQSAFSSGATFLKDGTPMAPTALAVA